MSAARAAAQRKRLRKAQRPGASGYAQLNVGVPRLVALTDRRLEALRCRGCRGAGCLVVGCRCGTTDERYPRIPRELPRCEWWACPDCKGTGAVNA